MKKTLGFLLILGMALMLLASCRSKDVESTTENVSVREVKIDTENAVYVNSGDLHKGMARTEVEKKWGPPLDSPGAGVSILVYMENEERMLILYFDMDDNLNKVEAIVGQNESIIIFE